MRELKRLLLGFLAFSLCIAFAYGRQWPDRVVLWREALGLYNAGKCKWVVELIERYRSKIELSQGEYLLTGMCYERLGNYDKALRYLNKAWYNFEPTYISIYAAVEEAKIRAFAFKNIIGAVVVLELLKDKLKNSVSLKDELLFNIWYLKQKLGFNADAEKRELLERFPDSIGAWLLSED